MAITDKTRKLLWGRSGNLCAMRRRELSVDGTPVDADSVVGDECHIVSGQPGGPRYRMGYDATEHDAVANLILLCKVHHKQVDDQAQTYSADVLRRIRANHEKWVTDRLSPGADGPKPIRIRKMEGGDADVLVRLTSGKEILSQYVVRGGSARMSQAAQTWPQENLCRARLIRELKSCSSGPSA
jgi:hypothetical protein